MCFGIMIFRFYSYLKARKETQNDGLKVNFNEKSNMEQ